MVAAPGSVVCFPVVDAGAVVVMTVHAGVVAALIGAAVVADVVVVTVVAEVVVVTDPVQVFVYVVVNFGRLLTAGVVAHLKKRIGNK